MPESVERVEGSHKKANRYTADDAPADLLMAAASDEVWWPTRYQYKVWWTRVIAELGVTPDGWWYGFCLKHDEAMDAEKPSALYNFKSGVMRCLGEPCCHERRAVSLVNFRNEYNEEIARVAQAR